MSPSQDVEAVLARELEYHERLYSGFAQRRFAQAAVREFRVHLVRHILSLAGAGSGTRVLSVGCGIGDTEIAMAPSVREIVGVDLSGTAVRQARSDAQQAGLKNIRFIEGTLETAGLLPESFDLAIGIFFLHHLPDALLAAIPCQIGRLLTPRGQFYGLDPSRTRLSGAVGSLLIPWIMKQHQSPDERELEAGAIAAVFQACGFKAQTGLYDFLSTPLAGLFPQWRRGYLWARSLDNLLVRTPGVRRVGSNVEILACKTG